MARKVTMEVFLERAYKVHGDKYKYPFDDFENISAKIPVECSRHGVFHVKASNHLRGDKCAKCTYEDSAGKYHARTAEDFYRQAYEVHGDEYTFGEIVDFRANKKIPVLCKKHGYFYPNINNFLKKGTRCNKCRSEENGLKCRITQEQVMSMCEENLSDKGMTFEKTFYNGRDKPIIVTCGKHGDIEVNIEFIQKGRYCPYCRKEDPFLPGGPSFYMTDLPSHIYLMIVTTEEKQSFLKVGIAVDVRNRIACFKRDAKGSGVTYHLLASFIGGAKYVRSKELGLLRETDKLETVVKFSGYTECRDTKLMYGLFFDLVNDPKLTLVEVSETMNILMNQTTSYKGKVL